MSPEMRDPWCCRDCLAWWNPGHIAVHNSAMQPVKSHAEDSRLQHDCPHRDEAGGVTTPAGWTSNFPVNWFLFARLCEREEHRVRSDDPALGPSPIRLLWVTCSNVLHLPESRFPPPSPWEGQLLTRRCSELEGRKGSPVLKVESGVREHSVNEWQPWLWSLGPLVSSCAGLRGWCDK